MKFTKYNNPNKKKYKRKFNKTEADIMAGKQMVIDNNLGYKIVPKTYDEISDKLHKEGRN